MLDKRRYSESDLPERISPNSLTTTLPIGVNSLDQHSEHFSKNGRHVLVDILSPTNSTSAATSSSLNIHQEIQLLTAALFEEANNLVAREAKEKYNIQKKYEKLHHDYTDLQYFNESLSSELSCLKTELQALRRKLPESSPISSIAVESSILAQEDLSLELNETFLRTVISNSPLVLNSKVYLYNELFLFLKDDKNLSGIFSKQVPKPSLILKNGLFHEVEPLLLFSNSKLRPKQILVLIIENNIFIEKSNICPPYKACDLCCRQNYSQPYSYFDSGNTFFHVICNLCKQNIYVVCELLTYFRLIHMKILKLDSDFDKEMIYCRFCYIKRVMFYLLSGSYEFFKIIDAQIVAMNS